MKLIATDYDGTLNFGGIDDAKRNMVSLWRKEGNVFGVISGRSCQSILAQLNKDNVECDFIVGNNGATVCDGNGKIIEQTTADKIALDNLLKVAFVSGCEFGCVHCSDLFFKVNFVNDTSLKDEYNIKNYPQINSFNQVSFRHKSTETAKAFAKKINENFSGVLCALQNGVWIDVVPFGVNKGYGVNRLIEIFLVKEEDIITVGDNENDIDMLKPFNSFAMENGVEAAKKAAKNITTSVTEIIINNLKK